MPTEARADAPRTPLHRRSERATALMLVPALLLVLMTLGGVGVDMALTHSAQRAAYKTLSAAADDAAGMLDGARLQADGTVALDRSAAERVARAHLGVLPAEVGDRAVGAARIGAVESLPYRVVSSGVTTTDDSVTITATIEVDHIFLGAVPGLQDRSRVTVTTTGRLLR